ncbi:MAG: BON domain-containing protein [bacterium]|nr:BON domain-containing protein [Chitinophagaceae bacterium]
MKNDAQIQTDVQNQLKWEPQLNAAEIGVAVKNSIVTLSGIVDTYPKKMTAERITKNVIGVKAVALDIQVGISPVNRKSDTEIAEACVNALRWDSSVPDDKLKVKVENATVTIEGTVEWGYQRLAAKNAIVKLTGVKGVNNMVVVKQKPSSIDIKQRIRESFITTAGHEADNIRLEVLGSKVVLRGSVKSHYEKEEAENTAWATPGVNEVENKIEVVYEEFFESA